MVQQAGKEVCEDRVGVAGPLAWVIDGATPLSSERLTASPSDASWLADRLEFHLRALAEDALALGPLTLLSAELISRVGRDAQACWSANPDVPPSAAFGLLRNRGVSVDYLVLADVTIHGAQAGVSVTDSRIEDSTRSIMEQLRRLLDQKHSHATAMEEIRPLLLAGRAAKMNRAGGYWVASTNPAAAYEALTGTFESCQSDRILLCTDGFSRAWDTFGLFPGPADLLACDVDAGEIVRRLRNAERADADCAAHPRWARHDDAAALIVSPVDLGT